MASDSDECESTGATQQVKQVVTIDVRGEDIYVAHTRDGRQTGSFVADNNSQSVDSIRKKCIPYIRQKALFLCNDVTFCDRAFLDHEWRVWLADLSKEKRVGTERSSD